jgi:hypothetical protein
MTTRKSKRLRIDGEAYKVIYDDDGVSVLGVARQRTSASGDTYWFYMNRRSPAAQSILAAL